jgi:hypothetical protein
MEPLAKLDRLKVEVEPEAKEKVERDLQESDLD